VVRVESVVWTKDIANLLQAIQAIRSLEKPTRSQYRSIRNWFENERPVVLKEMDFIYHKDDLLAVAPTMENTLLGMLTAIFEHLLAKLDSPFVRVSAKTHIFATSLSFETKALTIS
jgi:hypothetical protein